MKCRAWKKFNYFFSCFVKNVCSQKWIKYLIGNMIASASIFQSFWVLSWINVKCMYCICIGDGKSRALIAQKVKMCNNSSSLGQEVLILSIVVGCKVARIKLLPIHVNCSSLCFAHIASFHVIIRLRSPSICVSRYWQCNRKTASSMMMLFFARRSLSQRYRILKLRTKNFSIQWINLKFYSQCK